MFGGIALALLSGLTCAQVWHCFGSSLGPDMCPSVTLLWLFSRAWDAVKLTLKVGFICHFVVDDPTDLDATIVVAQALC